MKDRINITIDVERLKEVRKIAEENNRSLSSQIDTIIKEWLKDKNYTGNEYEWGQAYIEYINMDGTPRQDCNECKLILWYKQSKETPKPKKEKCWLYKFMFILKRE